MLDFAYKQKGAIFMKGLAMKMVVAFLYLMVIGIPYWYLIGLL